MNEDLSIINDYELTTDEILALYKNVEIYGDESITTDEIIKMYETDAEKMNSDKDFAKVKKTSRKKKCLKKLK